MFEPMMPKAKFGIPWHCLRHTLTFLFSWPMNSPLESPVSFWAALLYTAFNAQRKRKRLSAPKVSAKDARKYEAIYRHFPDFVEAKI